MQTLEHPDLAENPGEEPKISGFDSGNRSLFKEPTLYLSVLGFLIISFLALGNTPALFWTAFLALSAVSVIFHIFAERFIFASRAETRHFSLPYEGMFVVTFGSILPGISLLAYSLYSLINANHPVNYPLEFGKILLLMTVPVFNFIVWLSVRRKYLARPRVAGMMNGVSLGLSLSWSIIWLKTCFFSSAAASCKFGWMFLLCVSPFLLLAAIFLQNDLCRKTEEKIGKITLAFSLLGIFLSLLFVFTPTIHIMVVQAAIQEARKAEPDKLAQSIAYLKSIASDEDIRPSEHAVSGLGLGGMLIADRGLESGQNKDKELFFRIKGIPYNEVGQRQYTPETWKPEEVKNTNELIGAKVAGLSLAKSQMIGCVDTRAMAARLDWVFTFHNAYSSGVTPRAEIALPPGAVVTDATIWMNSQQQGGIIVPTQVPKATHRTPVLVSYSGEDKVLINCPNVAGKGGKAKFRISFSIPLNVKGEVLESSLPKIAESNFSEPKRTHLHLESESRFISQDGISRKGNGFSFDSILKSVNPDETPNSKFELLRTSSPSRLAFLDKSSKTKRFIIQKIESLRNYQPERLAIVIDGSEQMRPHLQDLKKALSSLPNKLGSTVYFAKTISAGDDIKPSTLTDAMKLLESKNFEGGQENGQVLREAIETIAERSNGAVLWIHGPQPLADESIRFTPFDLGNKTYLYDYEVQSGPNALAKDLGIGSIQNSSDFIYRSVKSTASIQRDVNGLITAWVNPSSGESVHRSISVDAKDHELLTDALFTDVVNSLWAREEVSRLSDMGALKEAQELSVKYHIVTPSAQIVASLDSAKTMDPSLVPDDDKSENRITYVGNTAISTKGLPQKTVLGGLSLRESSYVSTQGVSGSFGAVEHRNGQSHEPGAQSQGGGGLVGAPVDPRYGQNNEIGQLADYGYDTARDISRVVTALSTLFAIPIGLSLMRRRKGANSVQGPQIIKGLALAFSIPTVVHLVGTYLINNFGGLGGGL